MNEGNLTRLNKFISASGLSSRRKIDELILQGRVTVNSRTVSELGIKIDPEKDIVKVDGETIRKKSNFIYVLLNKPAGYITTLNDEKNRRTVMDLIGVNQRIYPVGRLDYETEGLLLLTNDGELANRLMHPKFEITKTYQAKLNRPIDEKTLRRLERGVLIDGRKTSVAKVNIVTNTGKTQIRISIHEGRNRQVRKMLESVGVFVRKLKRTGYANLNDNGLKIGGWRYLTAIEVSELKKTT
ncbi:MAG: pseudouridine synthase [Ignavibacteria bacterium]|jgi:23S rRNA pseudouridine2605 synthase